MRRLSLKGREEVQQRRRGRKQEQEQDKGTGTRRCTRLEHAWQERKAAAGQLQQRINKLAGFVVPSRTRGASLAKEQEQT